MLTLGDPRRQRVADQGRPGRLRTRTPPEHDHQLGRKGQNCDVKFQNI